MARDHAGRLHTTGSDKLTAQARWRINGQNAKADPAWSALRQPTMVTRAFRGEAVAAPVFEKK